MGSLSNEAGEDPLEYQEHWDLARNRGVYIYRNDEAGVEQVSIGVEGTNYWLESFSAEWEAQDWAGRHGFVIKN